MNPNPKPAIQVVIALVTLAMCVTIHELGHALASVLTGGVVTQIVVFDAHPHIRVLASADGATQLIRIAAGSGLVMLIWLAWCVFSWGSVKSFSFNVLSLFAGVELMGWFLSCFRVDTKQADDAVDFIASSGITSAALASLVLLIGAAGGLILFLGRHTIQSRSGGETPAVLSSSDFELPVRTGL